MGRAIAGGGGDLVTGIARIGRAVAAAALLVALMFPIYWTIRSSLAAESQLFESPALVLTEPSLEHYRALFDERDFFVPIRNSLIVAGATTLLALPVAILCAYALARLRMRGKSFAARADSGGLDVSADLARATVVSGSPRTPAARHLSGIGLSLPNVRDAAGCLAAHRLLPAAAA